MGGYGEQVTNEVEMTQEPANTGPPVFSPAPPPARPAEKCFPQKKKFCKCRSSSSTPGPNTGSSFGLFESTPRPTPRPTERPTGGPGTIPSGGTPTGTPTGPGPVPTGPEETTIFTIPTSTPIFTIPTSTPIFTTPTSTPSLPSFTPSKQTPSIQTSSNNITITSPISPSTSDTATTSSGEMGL